MEEIIKEELSEQPEPKVEEIEGNESPQDTEKTVEEEENRDYSKIIEEDLNTLRACFEEMREIKDITELENPLRYAELRDLGLSPEEAYLATARKRARKDNRAHLSSSFPKPRGARSEAMSYQELENARELFPSLSDREIQKLYKQVTK